MLRRKPRSVESLAWGDRAWIDEVIHHGHGSCSPVFDYRVKDDAIFVITDLYNEGRDDSLVLLVKTLGRRHPIVAGNWEPGMRFPQTDEEAESYDWAEVNISVWPPEPGPRAIVVNGIPRILDDDED